MRKYLKYSLPIITFVTVAATPYGPIQYQNLPSLVGPGLAVCGTNSSQICSSVPDATSTTSYTITSSDMGGQRNMNGSSLTATIPAISSSILAQGQSVVITNYNSTLLTISSSPTINGFPAYSGLGLYGWGAFVSNGTSLDAIGFPGYGTITSNALMKFSGTLGVSTASSFIDDGTTISTTEGIVLNSATGGNKGSGTINATGVYINGSAVTIGGASLTATQSFSGANTFASVLGSSRVQSGTTDTLTAADCGKTVLYTSASAVTVTIPQSIVPASGTTCIIGILEGGASKVSVNGTAVSAATLVSASSFTGTSGTAGAVIDLILTTVSSTATAYLTGQGS